MPDLDRLALAMSETETARSACFGAS